MKRCMICGWEDAEGSAFTCPACGEASWLPLEAAPAVAATVKSEPVEPLVILSEMNGDAVEVAPAKRGPGRPRKQQ